MIQIGRVMHLHLPPPTAEGPAGGERGLTVFRTQVTYIMIVPHAQAP